jgi:hypothetical protein
MFDIGRKPNAFPGVVKGLCPVFEGRKLVASVDEVL